MKSNRENLTDVFEGRRPEYIPLTIYEDFVDDDPYWDELFASGLCKIPFRYPFKEINHNMLKLTDKKISNGRSIEHITLKTPVGEVHSVLYDGWTEEYFLKTPEDYSVMKYIVENTKLEFDPKPFLDEEKVLGEKGITQVLLKRSPMQTILVDYAGLENFAYHLADGFPQLF